MKTKLFVEGFPSWITDQDLRGLFLCHGTVLSATVVKGARGQSLEFGYVEMATPHEASAAIQRLNRTPLSGRHLLVKLAEQETTRLTWDG